MDPTRVDGQMVCVAETMFRANPVPLRGIIARWRHAQAEARDALSTGLCRWHRSPCSPLIPSIEASQYAHFSQELLWCSAHPPA
jgi:hypothetical protein